MFSIYRLEFAKVNLILSINNHFSLFQKSYAFSMNLSSLMKPSADLIPYPDLTRPGFTLNRN